MERQGFFYSREERSIDEVVLKFAMDVLLFLGKSCLRGDKVSLISLSPLSLEMATKVVISVHAAAPLPLLD